jgi:hypothetical protein
MRNFAFGDTAKLPQAAQLVVAVSHYHPACEASSNEIHEILGDSPQQARAPSHRVGPGEQAFHGLLH